MQCNNNHEASETLPQELTRIIGEYKRQLRVKALEILPSTELVKDALQETFKAYYEARKSGKVIRSPFSYLYKVLINHCTRIVNSPHTGYISINEEINFPTSEIDLYDRLDAKQLYISICEYAINYFTEHEQKVFYELFRLGNDQETCAKNIESSKDSIKSTKYKILNLLKKRFGNHPIIIQLEAKNKK